MRTATCFWAMRLPQYIRHALIRAPRGRAIAQAGPLAPLAPGHETRQDHLHHLPLKGGGRGAQRAGWGSLAARFSFGIRGYAPALGTCRLAECKLGRNDGDFLEHAGRVFNDIRVPESKDSNVSRHQPRFALLVALKLAGQVVLSAVELDRETELRTIKIQHVWPGRMLTAELVAVDLPVAEAIPQTALHTG